MSDLPVRRSASLFAALALLVFPGASHGAVSAYTSQSSFLAATAGDLQPQTVNFDNLPALTLFPSGSGTGGLTFSYALSGTPVPTLQVDTGFSTTSGSNYLGLNNGNGAFYTGTQDGFTIQFNHPVNAVGLYVIAGGGVAAGDFTLTLAQGSVSNSGVPDVVFADGSTAFYLGLVSSGSNASFSSATLSSGTPTSQFYAFNVDDISSAVSPVPEPASVWLMVLGLGLLSRLYAGRPKLPHLRRSSPP